MRNERKKKEERRKKKTEKREREEKRKDEREEKEEDERRETRDERREKEIRILVENHNVTQRRHTRQQTRTMNTVGMKCNVRAARVANKQNAR